MKLVLFVGTILYGVYCKEKKYFWLWCALLCVLITNTSVDFADFDNYERYFLRVTSGEMGILYMGMPAGWYYLCLGFARIGLSYRGMYAVLIFISFYLVHRFVNNIECKEGMFWSLFLIFPGLIQILQIRFFFGSAIVFWALGPLVKKEKLGLLRFFGGVIASYFIHSSCLILIVFAFVVLFEIFDIKKAIVFSVGGAVILYLMSTYIPSLIAGYIPAAKLERYFESSISETTALWFIRITIVWLICLCFGVLCVKKIKKCKIRTNQVKTNVLLRNNNKNRLINKFRKGERIISPEEFNLIVAPKMIICIALLCLTLVFLKFDRNFHRFLEVGYMILFVLVARLWRYWKIDRKNKTIYLLLFVIFLCRLMYIYTPYQTVLLPFITYSGFHSLLL